MKHKHSVFFRGEKGAGKGVGSRKIKLVFGD